MLRRIMPESLNIRVSTTDGPVKALNSINFLFFFALLFYLKKGKQKN